MYLLDTNVLSELRKARIGKSVASVEAWARQTDPDEMYISVLTIMEIEIGILQLRRRHDEGQASIFSRWFDDHVMPEFKDRMLPVSIDVARCAAALHVPDRRPERDGLIAATAIVHRMTVVTRNRADFEGTGLSIINPWDA